MQSDDLKKQLVDLRDELNQRIEGIQPDMAAGRSRDSEEQAQEMENDEVLQALAMDARNEIGETERALTRMDNGTYGTCANCAEPIAEDRLKAYPMAEKCIKCA